MIHYGLQKSSKNRKFSKMETSEQIESYKKD
jgi:hypothetical protein